MEKRGRSRGDISRWRCLLSEAVLLTKPGIAEGCAARKMDDDRELRSHVVGSRDDETRDSCDGVEGLRRRSGRIKWFKILSPEEP
jgi:hypothetical protein